MKRTKILLPLFVLLSGFNTVVAKSEDKDLLKADFLYRHYAFYEAIPYYEKAVMRTEDAGVYGKLGDSYMLIKDPTNAVKWYAKAVEKKDCHTDIKLHYGQALMTLQRYDEAITYLEAYKADHPSERRVANLIASCSKENVMQNSLPVGVVNFASINTDGSEFGPFIKGEELVYTTDSLMGNKGTVDKWTGNSYYNIYATKCDMAGNCGNESYKVSGKVNTKYHDGPAVFTSSGAEMYFTRTNYTSELINYGSVPGKDGVVRLQIMIADDYDKEDKTYKSMKPFKYNSKDYSTAHPTISPDGQMLIFSSDKPNGIGGSDLYVCMKEGKDSWSMPVNIGELINTEGEELFPFLSSDYTLYFASNGHVGKGGLDIYASKWDNKTNAFSKPVNVGAPVNSPYDDMSITLYEDGKTGYFASNKPASKSGDNIYYVKFQNIYLAVDVKDAYTRQPVSAPAISILNTADTRSFTADASGTMFTKVFPSSQYKVQVSKQGYKPQELDFSTYNLKDNDTIRQEVLLVSDFNINYNLVVLDENTKQPIDNALIVFAKLGGGSADSTDAYAGNIYTKDLEANSQYSIYAVKEKYYSNERVISTAGINPNSGATRINDTIYMKELKIGEVYRIDNIYYDYDKASIREDAKPSLNVLLNLLSQYPDMTIRVNSHTDCRGANAYNMNLSKARAASVIRYLQEREVKASRLSSKGFGETMPVEKCSKCEICTEEQHQRNRRTEFQIISM